MRFILLVIAATVIIFACSKPSLETTPQLKYRSVNETTISGSKDIQIRLDITDKEGDFTNLLGVRKIVLGGCAADTFTELSKFFIPQDFVDSKEREGEVVVTLEKSNRGANSCLLPGGLHFMTDTVMYLFWTQDRAGHFSDTTQTEKIIIIGD